MSEPTFGPAGRVVYERTYSRTNAGGTKEDWAQTVTRVARGNLALTYGAPETWSDSVWDEYRDLFDHIHDFRIIPAGRHLWATGVPGRQYLFNCHVSGWGQKLSDHFSFTFLRLMEGGGVGANYSSYNLEPYGTVERALKVHIVCDPSHPDFEAMKSEGLLSEEYSYDWAGPFPVEDSREGWSAALVDLVDTFMTTSFVSHSNRVYDVSRVRASGQPLRTFGGTASGPAPLARLLLATGKTLSARVNELVRPLDAMDIDHEIGACVVAGGNRRSARMSIVRWDDPYIFDFINCKSDPSKHWTTNISVEIDADFIRQLEGAPLERQAECRDMKAWMVHRAVVEGMLTNGEPGYWNSSLSNEGEPNPVVCTNPCGEIALQEWENCNLGHVNMDAFAPKQRGASVDFLALYRAHRLMTRFLIRATYGDVSDPKQAEMLAANRRIGVGHFGVQGFLAKQGIKFSKAPGNVAFSNLLGDCYKAVRNEARTYAFALRIPEPVKVTTVAPTGSIAKLAGKTEGIHPVYARHFIRRVRFSTVDAAQFEQVMEFALQGFHVEADKAAANTVIVEFPTKESLVEEVEALGYPAETVESADEISLEDMLDFQALYQQWYADNAVSFTVNVPVGRHSVEHVMKVLGERLHALKGTTLMPDGTREQAPYERLTAAQYEALQGPKVVADSTDEECANGACPVR